MKYILKVKGHWVENKCCHKLQFCNPFEFEATAIQLIWKTEPFKGQPCFGLKRYCLDIFLTIVNFIVNPNI